MTDLTMQATVRMQKNIAERLEKEILGAWQAGYSFLYVTEDINTWQKDSKTEVALSVGMRAKPTHYRLEHNPSNAVMKEYDLRDLTPEKVREYKQ